MNAIKSMARGDRRTDEIRVFMRRTIRFPFYVQKHPGKTPGKVCSCAGCGNPRRHLNEVTRQELAASVDDSEFEPVFGEYDFDCDYDMDDDDEFRIGRDSSPLSVPLIDAIRIK